MYSTLIIQALFISMIFLSNSAKFADSQTIISFSTGGFHACAAFDTKQLKCWGWKASWGLSIYAGENWGDQPNEMGSNLPFIDVGTSVGVEQVSCGSTHICVKLDTGDMKCLGTNHYGEAGSGLTTDPIGDTTGYIGNNLPIVNVGTGLSVLNVALGSGYTCVRLTGNKVKCFGQNNFGQLGQGDTINRGKASSDMGDNLPFINFGTNVEVASVHSRSSADHSCVILSLPSGSAQRIKCWGLNNYYQLGYGGTNNKGDAANEMGSNLPLVNLGTESRVKQLTLGESHTCALLFNNNMKCWGVGAWGQVGSGSTATISSTGNAMPVVASGTGTIKFLSGGDNHNCIVYNNQLTMKCFGDNTGGQLGQGDILTRGYSPTTRLPNIPAIDLGTGSLQIASIHGGYRFNCVVFVDSSVKCFGSNNSGRLGIGSYDAMGDDPNEMGANLQFTDL